MADADRAATDLRSYFADLAAQCRAAPRDDLASALVATEAGADGQARFTHDELLQTLTFVFMAGVDTMTNYWPTARQHSWLTLGRRSYCGRARTSPPPPHTRYCATTRRSSSSAASLLPRR